MSAATSRRVAFAVAAALLVATGPAAVAQDGTNPGGRRPGGAGGQGAQGGGPAGVFRTDVPAHPVDVIAGRPAERSVVLSVRTATDMEGSITWRPAADGAPKTTATQRFPAGAPVEIALDGLAPDTAYTAQFVGRSAPDAAPESPDPVVFHTQRAAGSPFVFTVQADSHLDVATQPALYERTAKNVALSAPDFHIDLGDTFMVDKRRDDFRASLPQYAAQRWYLSLTRAPVLLVLGNHDGETGWRDTGSADDMPHWSNAQRKRNFPNPEPGGIYTGNAARDPLNGLLQNWYGFEWGDAQFLVLDPFWSTQDRKGREGDGWSWTLGEAQYRWLERSLAGSRAKYRFVFLHHLVGGLGKEARGGSEAALLWEWGGRSAAGGPDEFAARRPGWTAPIHELLRRAGPAVVFHGHDHFYARQELDGVVYQMVPQPGHPGGDAKRMAAEYGYAQGDFLPSPGFIRVRVAADAAVVEYLGSSLSDPAANTRSVASYKVAAPAPKSPAAPR